jgi:ribosome-associated translation inhibitor RaiA
MQPLQITFRNTPPSKTIERLVRQKARKLEEFNGRIVKCHVTLETQQQRHRKGNLYDVHLDIQIPGKSFAVTSAQHDSNEYELLSMAIRDAFDMAQRRLQDHMGARRRKRRSLPAIGDVPSAAARPTQKISGQPQLPEKSGLT